MLSVDYILLTIMRITKYFYKLSIVLYVCAAKNCFKLKHTIAFYIVTKLIFTGRAWMTAEM